MRRMELTATVVGSLLALCFLGCPLVSRPTDRQLAVLSMPDVEQAEAIRGMAPDEALELQVVAMTRIEPPMLGVDRVIARNGQGILPALARRISSERSESALVALCLVASELLDAGKAPSTDAASLRLREALRGASRRIRGPVFGEACQRAADDLDGTTPLASATAEDTRKSEPALNKFLGSVAWGETLASFIEEHPELRADVHPFSGEGNQFALAPFPVAGLVVFPSATFAQDKLAFINVRLRCRHDAVFLREPGCQVAARRFARALSRAEVLDSGTECHVHWLLGDSEVRIDSVAFATFVVFEASRSTENRARFPWLYQDDECL